MPTALDRTTAAGIVTVSAGAGFGELVASRGDVQYGTLLLGAQTGSEVTGWRDTPDTAVSDTTRPQAHGAYPGDIWAEASTVMLTYRIPGPPLVPLDAREAALRVIEAGLPLDSVERPLVFHDGDTTFRMARVLQRVVPRPWDFAYSKALTCSVQWLCADPRRYSLDLQQVTVAIPTASGGLTYPMTYPLSYGTSQGGSRPATNDGSASASPVVVFTGPLTSPALVADRWRLAFDLTLGAGETLVVDTGAGTALLNGEVDRLYTISATSSPLERCSLTPGTTALTLTAAAGTGQATVTYRHAYL